MDGNLKIIYSHFYIGMRVLSDTHLGANPECLMCCMASDRRSLVCIVIGMAQDLNRRRGSVHHKAVLYPDGIRTRPEVIAVLGCKSRRGSSTRTDQ